MRKVGYYRHVAGEVDPQGHQYCTRCGLLLTLPRERRFQPGERIASKGTQLRFRVPSGVPVLVCFDVRPAPEIPRPVSPFDPSRFTAK